MRAPCSVIRYSNSFHLALVFWIKEVGAAVYKRTGVRELKDLACEMMKPEFRSMHRMGFCIVSLVARFEPRICLIITLPTSFMPASW
jgi:hypothetical protein